MTTKKRFIKGVGMTKFGNQQTPVHLLAYEAATAALKDAQFTIEDIDAIVISNMDAADDGFRQRHLASVLSSLFQVHIPIFRVPAVCSGGGVAFWVGAQLAAKNVLVIGAEKILANASEHATENILMAADSFWEQEEGGLFPVQNALVAQQYMQNFDLTLDDLALVAFKNHQNAALNPKAKFYKKPISLEQIKKSPVVASPLRLFDCSVSVNGSAAVILTYEKTDVELVGSGFATSTITPFEREKMYEWQATKIAAEQAYQQANLTPEQIDLAEVHDAFTILEIMAYEDLGFAQKGKGYELIRSGKVNLDGDLPINPSGGLKAKGHPISATGTAQIYEMVRQLRGNCDDRQVKNAQIGLTHNIGGAGGSITVNIFRKV